MTIPPGQSGPTPSAAEVLQHVRQALADLDTDASYSLTRPELEAYFTQQQALGQLSQPWLDGFQNLFLRQYDALDLDQARGIFARELYLVEHQLSKDEAAASQPASQVQLPTRADYLDPNLPAEALELNDAFAAQHPEAAGQVQQLNRFDDPRVTRLWVKLFEDPETQAQAGALLQQYVDYGAELWMRLPPDIGADSLMATVNERSDMPGQLTQGRVFIADNTVEAPAPQLMVALRNELTHLKVASDRARAFEADGLPLSPENTTSWIEQEGLDPNATLGTLDEEVLSLIESVSEPGETLNVEEFRQRIHDAGLYGNAGTEALLQNYAQVTDPTPWGEFSLGSLLQRYLGMSLEAAQPFTELMNAAEAAADSL